MLKILKKKKFDIEAFIAGSHEGMRLIIDTHKKNWGLGKEQSWKVDEAAGEICFTFADGTEVSAPLQIVGTYSVADKVFTWGWNHPAVAVDLQRHAARVKAFGEEYSSQELKTAQIPCTEKRAWEYTALAMLLAEANGAYCVQGSPGMLVFITFGDVTIEKKAGN
ncbi:hypothetical protein BH11PSE11_BH11PSE11_35320 [soil metagenome]